MKQRQRMQKVTRYGIGLMLGVMVSSPVLAAATTGLWVGRVEVTHVNQVHGALKEGEGNDETEVTECYVYPTGEVAESCAELEGVPQPVPHPFQLQMVLHVDDGGAVKLLREAYIMQTKSDAETPVQRVIVTDDTKLSDYDGIIRRDGKLVAVRMSSTSFPIEGAASAADVVGQIGSGQSLSLGLKQERTHPTNPFRHQYHPMHANFASADESYGVELNRQVTLNISTPEAGESVDPELGLNKFEGEYLETLQGLHKNDLKVAGNFVLTRLNQIPRINVDVVADYNALVDQGVSQTESLALVMSSGSDRESAKFKEGVDAIQAELEAIQAQKTLVGTSVADGISVVTDKLNTIKDKINNMITAFNELDSTPEDGEASPEQVRMEEALQLVLQGQDGAGSTTVLSLLNGLLDQVEALMPVKKVAAAGGNES